LTKPAEETLRQKILVSWLLNQPLKFHASTRELILYGSCNWTTAIASDDPPADATGPNTATSAAAWWDLPDGLEAELAHRRDCILNTIASIPRHFLALYTSSRKPLPASSSSSSMSPSLATNSTFTMTGKPSPVTTQCKRGYDSSTACDSYQLGEMVRFLAGRGLLFLVDFSPRSLDAVRDFAAVDVSAHLLALLRQCPAYQIDKNHTNCGLRTRILPLLDYVQAMLSSTVVGIPLAGWRKDRHETSWASAPDAESGRFGGGNGGGRDPDGGGSARVFRFTRSLAGDQRLRYEGAMAADRMARMLFTADEWDWTPEE